MGIATMAFVVPTSSAPRPEWHPWAVAVAEPVALIAYAYPGFVVARRRPHNRIGWFLLISGFGGVLDAFAHAYTDYGLTRELSGVTLAGWVSNWAFALNFFPVYFLLLCFPDGRLPSGRWRAVTWYVSAGAVFSTSVASFGPGPIDRSYYPTLQNPFGIPLLKSVVQHEGLLSFFLVAFPFLMAASSLLFRFRGSTGVARQQFKWVAFAALVDVALVALTIPFHKTAWLTVAINLVLVVLSGSISVAIVRHNLFDIDWLLSRTLVYLGLTGCVAGLYISCVSLFGLLLRHPGSGVVPLLATAMVAVALQPLRGLLQGLVSRLVYGLRDDPYTALGLLGRRLEAVVAPHRVLAEAAATVAEALRLPYVALELHGSRVEGSSGGGMAVFGTPTTAVLYVSLAHQGEVIGTLSVGVRAGEESLSRADRRLLEDVSRHVAQAVVAAGLSVALQLAHQRAVAARAEERRRIVGDLRDGIEPALISAAATIDGACALAHTDPERALDLLAVALTHTRRGSDDLRRVSVGLRSPVSQLGLREAILSYVERVSLAMHTTLPDEIPCLPAAVEEAAYWVLVETLAPVMRHGQAHNCWIRLEVTNEEVALSVAHDSGARTVLVPALLHERVAVISGQWEARPSAENWREFSVRFPRSLPSAHLPGPRECIPLLPGVVRRQGGRAGGER